MNTQTVKRIYIKIFKFKIKQDEHVNKTKLIKTFSKRIQISEDLNGIIVKVNVAVALGWNGHSETGLVGLSRKLKKALARLYRK